MNFDTQIKALASASKKNVKIGSPVSKENREWLKRHGIVTDRSSSPPKPPFSMKPFFAQLERPVGVVLAIIFCALPFFWFQERQHFVSQIESEQSRLKNLDYANGHLRGSIKKLSSINQAQQGEINQVANQLRVMSHRFDSQIGGLRRTEAMSNALHQVFNSELGRMTDHYDVEVEFLRRQVLEKDQMISSLETSIQSMDGVVVSADRVSDASGLANGIIAAVNQDFQFVVVNVGELKGARVGQMAELYHQGILIGYGQVEKTYPEFSGVKVFSFEVLSRLEKGDSAFLKMI